MMENIQMRPTRSEVSDEVRELLEQTESDSGIGDAEFNETSENYEIVFGRTWRHRPG